MTYTGIGAGGLLLVIQVIMLVLYYGTTVFTQTMPWWVLWLPSLIILGIIGIVVTIVVVIFLLAVMFA